MYSYHRSAIEYWRKPLCTNEKLTRLPIPFSNFCIGDIDQALLTGDIASMAELIGVAGTIKLVMHFGGNIIYWPKLEPLMESLRTGTVSIGDIDQTCLAGDVADVAELIGVPSTIKLVLHFGGTSIYFPKLAPIMEPIRNEAIVREFDGHNHKALARKYRFSVQHVYRLIRRQKVQALPVELTSKVNRRNLSHSDAT